MKIGNVDIEKQVFIIAELSGNHNGSLELAKETIRSAKRAGADCIKLQTYTADTITLNVKSEIFKAQKGSAWDGQYLYELYQKASTPWEWHKELFETANSEGLICFSSPFDATAVDLLENLQTPAYKIASYEITDIPLIKYVASKGKPVIISTGIATEDDVEEAIQTCHSVGNKEIAILKCTSSYPTPPEDSHLITIPYIKSKWPVTVGLSDHTMGIEAPVASVALGARIIEKHFILSRELGGVDSHFSLDENEFTQMVNSVRTTEKMIGTVDLSMNKKKEENRQFSRSLFATQNIKKGEKFNTSNVRSIRPGQGLHPRYFEQIVNMEAAQDIPVGAPLSFDLVKSD